ncbi:lantibiotic dehydratase [Streptomyces rhizosphaericus]|uniref:Lantibiotic dehydratase n=1 Tax=Streptomyces rhizosphaericus TaxID=114699 RepID=A0A6G4AWV3_9ACTN|nr:lantibiotic dehydratase [Streptomyces rhizosphaericus]NEW77728.1 lantibiotic dehydratase [Streptomyces rhizosphaericus]
MAELASIPELMAAVELASPSLAADVRRVVEGHSVRRKVLRRVTVALTKYHLRMVQRPTPFGLFAGVVLADLGRYPRLDIGRGHRSVSRPDAGWLHKVLESVLTVRPALRRARLLVNNLHTVRDGRLVLVDFHSGSGHKLAPSVRYTPVVRAVLRAASEPTAWGDLLKVVRDQFPRAPEEAVERCLEQLAGSQFLLTDLAPPADCGAPLEYLLNRLDGLESPIVGKLRGIQEALHALDATARGARHAALIAARDRMQELALVEHPVQCDLLFDARVTLPSEVGEEVARVTDVLWRIAPEHPGNKRIGAYHRRFLERYGTGRSVPVLELLDEARGLGLPRAEGGSTAEHGAAAAAKRDRLLGELLCDAMRRGTQEIVLDDPTVLRLSPDRPPRTPRSADIGVEVVAASWEALCAGEFRLVLGLGVTSPIAASAFGRFMPALGATAEAQVQQLIDHAEAMDSTGELAAMVSFRPVIARSANVTTVPQWLPHRIPLGVAPAAAFTAHDLSLEHLGVRATTDRLELVSTTTGQLVRPVTYSMINPQSGHVPDVARFLIELGQQQEQLFGGWSWGVWSTAPALPRVRYGRSVLCPARWSPDENLFAESSECDESQWAAQVGRWRQQWGVPRHVLLGRGDNRIAVDLDDPLHLLVFRGELRQGPGLAVIERFGGAPSNEWFRGPDGPHACEFYFPVLRNGRATHVKAANGSNYRDRQAPDDAVHEGGPTANGVSRHLPGGEWLYAKLYVPEHHQLAVLTRHLGRLTEPTSGALTDTWFFIRYADPEPHLRLRFHGKPKALWGELLPVLRSWAAELGEAGLLSRLILDTYEPEIHRYGGTEAITHAEQAFHADSLAVVHHFMSPARQLVDLPDVSLAALGVLEILSHLCSTTSEMLHHLGGAPILALRGRVQRTEKQRLCTLVDEHGRTRQPVVGDRWQTRRTALLEFREVLHKNALDQGQPAGITTGAIAMSLAHMHCNRLLGIDREKEMLAYVTARESLTLRLDRMRYGR